MKIRDQLYCGFQTAWANFTGSRMPLSVYLNLTYRCANRCIYCNYPNLDEGKEHEMSTGQILKLIDEMAEAGTRKLQLTGGEPLLREDIGDIIHHAKKRGIFTGISASGIFIPECIDKIKDVDIIFISLDGERDVHDSIRGKGSCDKAIRAIEALKENNIDVWTTSVISKRNSKSIDYILGVAKRMRFIANFVLYYYINDNSNNHLSPRDTIKDLVLSNDENTRIIESLIRKKRAGEPIGSSYSYFEYLLNWKDFSVIHRKEIVNGVKCWAGKLFCHIDPCGMLYPCGTAHWRVKGHSVTELGLRKAFELSKNTPCESCILACHLENNLLFSLNIKATINWLKTLRGLN